MRLAPALFVLALASPAAAQVPPPPGKPVAIDATLSGQPIRAASGELRVTISQSVIPVGARLPVHKHPYPRLVNVLAGRLKITNLDTGQVRDAVAGDWMVDAVDQWHDAVVVGDEPVRLMAIDHAPPGATVTIPRAP